MHKLGILDVDTVYEEVHVLARQGLPDVKLYPDALAVLTAPHEADEKMALITHLLTETLQIY